jgi:DNA replication protein DnaC
MTTSSQTSQQSAPQAMAGAVAVLEEATIRHYCKQLRLPTVGAQFGTLAQEALRQQQGYGRYLEALLLAEVEERERGLIQRRLCEAHLPRLKTLEEFDFARAPGIPALAVLELAQGAYLARSEPVLLIGDCGTGKTHLATGLCVAACRGKYRVRFATAAGLVNELVEAQHQNQLSRALARWSRYDLIAIDEVGYVPLAELGAELLFQVIAERAEKAAVIITTNLPFSEWTQVFTNRRLCKALLDRLTDRAHIIETGSQSYRFRRSLESKGSKGSHQSSPESKLDSRRQQSPQLATDAALPEPPLERFAATVPEPRQEAADA